MTRRPSPRIAAALAVATALALSAAGVAVAVLPATGASADIPNCTVNHLYVAKGRLEGAAGGRFLTVRVTNVGDTVCVVPIADEGAVPRLRRPARKRRREPGPGRPSWRCSPATSASTVVHWSDPGPIPANECNAADATLVTLRLPGARPHLAAAAEGERVHDAAVGAEVTAAQAADRGCAKPEGAAAAGGVILAACPPP